jgi:hypothetical protein
MEEHKDNFALSETDKKILKFARQGCSLERIARRIGRPGDIERVKEGLRKGGHSK